MFSVFDMVLIVMMLTVCGAITLCVVAAVIFAVMVSIDELRRKKRTDHH